MTSYLDHPDSALLTLVARRDSDALAELFRRYAIVVLVAGGWTEDNAADAEQRAVDVFLDAWNRPEAYMPRPEPTRYHLIRAALRDSPEDAVRLAAVRLAELEGWTYHDVAALLARPSQHIARLIREELAGLRDDSAG